MMRKSTGYLAVTAFGILLLLFLIGLYPLRSQRDGAARIARQQALVDRWQLTDIALFTEAPYTRNPSLADRSAPFQNHPMAISQFPSESLLAPPEHLLREHRQNNPEAEP
ncbi:MAG: hypothetical protein RBS34_06605 [Desulfofustis sp.]|jgi:hypothetical protein|nr:hypothetical protein [Desulfofustis sp.]